VAIGIALASQDVDESGSDSKHVGGKAFVAPRLILV
jgi:hypothetical protein